MQEAVYITKKTQAQRYKDAGYQGDDLEYPYVMQYADFAGLSMRVAADEILLKATFDDEVLLKTEFFRLKYFELIKNMNDPGQADRITLDFRRECLKLSPVSYAFRSL
jgi:hypothetical protein